MLNQLLILLLSTLIITKEMHYHHFSEKIHKSFFQSCKTDKDCSGNHRLKGYYCKNTFPKHCVKKN